MVVEQMGVGDWPLADLHQPLSRYAIARIPRNALTILFAILLNLPFFVQQLLEMRKWLSKLNSRVQCHIQQPGARDLDTYLGFATSRLLLGQASLHSWLAFHHRVILLEESA